jgi:type I restriction enzyme S subunit
VPSEDVAAAFEALVHPLYLLMTRNAQQSRTLAAVRDALLPKLLSGEVRVKDAERFAEGAIESGTPPEG